MPECEIQQVGLIGWPIGHSLSPILHQAAFEACNLSWQYDLFPINPEHFQKEIAALLASNLIGFNVTAPHKEAIIQYLDGMDEGCKKLNAVNTVYKLDGGRWMGSNTDVIGLKKALIEFGIMNKVHKKVTILGNGGAARAVLAVLLDFPVQGIEILARDQRRSMHIIDQFKDGIKSGMEIRSCSISKKQVGESVGSADLVINATPIGMDHCVQKSLFSADMQIPKELKFVDLIYHPAETRMMQQVKTAGGMAWNGLDMLIYQAAASFTIWTGLDAPVERMKEAVLQRMPI